MKINKTQELEFYKKEYLRLIKETRAIYEELGKEYIYYYHSELVASECFAAGYLKACGIDLIKLEQP